MAKQSPPFSIARPVVPVDTAYVHPDPKWFRRLTLRRGAALMAVWLMCVLLVPMFLVVGVFMGAIKGMGIGLHEGVMEAWRALARAYELAAKE